MRCVKKIIAFFDKFEDKIRNALSHYPILYALVGAIGIILVWKGIWEIAELVPLLHGWGSFVLGVLILLASGLLVSFFIGDSIIISGLRREKKLVEQEEQDILEAGESQTKEILAKIEHLEHDMHSLAGEANDSSEKIIE